MKVEPANTYFKGDFRGILWPPKFRNVEAASTSIDLFQKLKPKYKDNETSCEPNAQVEALDIRWQLHDIYRNLRGIILKTESSVRTDVESRPFPIGRDVKHGDQKSKYLGRKLCLGGFAWPSSEIGSQAVGHARESTPLKRKLN